MYHCIRCRLLIPCSSQTQRPCTCTRQGHDAHWASNYKMQRFGTVHKPSSIPLGTYPRFLASAASVCPSSRPSSSWPPRRVLLGRPPLSSFVLFAISNSRPLTSHSHYALAARSHCLFHSSLHSCVLSLFAALSASSHLHMSMRLFHSITWI